MTFQSTTRAPAVGSSEQVGPLALMATLPGGNGRGLLSMNVCPSSQSPALPAHGGKQMWTGRDSGFICGLLFSQLWRGCLLPDALSQDSSGSKEPGQSVGKLADTEAKENKISCNSSTRRDTWTPCLLLRDRLSF